MSDTSSDLINLIILKLTGSNSVKIREAPLFNHSNLSNLGREFFSAIRRNNPNKSEFKDWLLKTSAIFTNRL